MRKDVALALLGLHENEPSEERINEAYRAAIQLNHPDRYASNERLRAHAEEQCKLINQARDTLLNGVQEPESNAGRPEGSPVERQSEARQYGSTWKPPERESWIPSETPVPDMWKTSAGFSVLGVVAFAILSIVGSNSTGTAAWIVTAVQLAYVLVQLLYATVVYPSFFTKKPKLKSNAAISFWNCAMGWFVFGPIWNSNLTKRSKGVAHIVFAVIVALLIAYWVFLFGFVAALGSNA